VQEATATLSLNPEFADPNFVRGLDQYSHLWLIGCFHQNINHGWKPTVRPPRLDGNTRMGVFATRSSFRPNGLSLSVVKLEEICKTGGCLELEISGIDLIEGTPIYDIKPYIPYADAYPDALAPWLQENPFEIIEIDWKPTAKQSLQTLKPRSAERISTLIRKVIAQDPRPASQRSNQTKKSFGILLEDLNISFQVQEQRATILSIELVR